MVIVKHNYACKECILLGNCSELCEEVIEGTYSVRLLNFIRNNKCCPDCGGNRMVVCGGDILKGNKVFIASSASCIECDSLYFTHDAVIGRYRKHRVIYSDEKVVTFWKYLFDNNFISGKVYNYGEMS